MPAEIQVLTTKQTLEDIELEEYRDRVRLDTVQHAVELLASAEAGEIGQLLTLVEDPDDETQCVIVASGEVNTSNLYLHLQLLLRVIEQDWVQDVMFSSRQ